MSASVPIASMYGVHDTCSLWQLRRVALGKAFKRCEKLNIIRTMWLFNVLRKKLSWSRFFFLIVFITTGIYLKHRWPVLYTYTIIRHQANIHLNKKGMNFKTIFFFNWHTCQKMYRLGCNITKHTDHWVGIPKTWIWVLTTTLSVKPGGPFEFSVTPFPALQWCCGEYQTNVVCDRFPSFICWTLSPETALFSHNTAPGFNAAGDNEGLQKLVNAPNSSF